MRRAPACSLTAPESNRRTRSTRESTIDNPLTPTGGQIPSHRRRRTLLLVLAGIAALAAVLVVVLSSGGSGSRRPAARLAGSAATGPTVVQLAARYLRLTPGQVRQQLGGGRTLAQIAAAKGQTRKGLIESIYDQRAAQIKARHLSPTRERAELEATRSALAERVSRHTRISSLTAAAARYLKLTVAQLDAKLRSGHTLASLAEASGRSRAGLLEAMTKGRREAIEEASAKGGTSKAAAKRRIARLLKRAERQIERAGG